MCIQCHSMKVSTADRAFYQDVGFLKAINLLRSMRPLDKGVT